MAGMVEFALAESKHVREFYGDRYTKSFKGYVAMLDGVVVGIGGISFEDGYMMLFSDMKDALRPFKKDIVRAITVLKRLIERERYPILAIANDGELMSEKLLVKLGFVFSGHETPDGKIFWRKP